MSDTVRKQNKDFFLPDFCQAQSLFLVVLIGELLAIIFTLLNTQPHANLWNVLAIYSLSIQSVSLVSVLILCVLRSWLANYSDWISGALSLSVVLLTTLVFTLVVISEYWVLPIDLTNEAQFSLLLRHLLIAGIIGAVALRYFYLQQQYRLELSLKASARLEALQARIRPHFLFNSMNVIASLTQIDPQKAESAIEDLSDLFRATLDIKEDLISLEKELENSKKYLAIEKLRLGERLNIDMDISPECLSVLIPPLSVQPLLENAVYHGIQMLPNGGTVSIKASVDNNMLKLTVSNPRAEQTYQRGHGIALKNISQRLEVIYGGRAQLDKQYQDDIYQITMQVPTKTIRVSES